MEEPIKITFRNIGEIYKDEIEADIREWAEKLDKFHPRIISCKVVVAMPNKRHREGNLYKTTLTVTVPGKQIAVSRESPFDHIRENFRMAIRNSFEEAERQLADYALIRDREVKDRETVPHGVISKIFPEGYGFIEGFGGREIYFHRNSVIDGFDKLRIGTEVRFEEEQGDKGPQASTVKISRKQHVYHRRV